MAWLELMLETEGLPTSDLAVLHQTRSDENSPPDTTHCIGHLQMKGSRRLELRYASGIRGTRFMKVGAAALP
jgi:hypothetical protein